MVKIRVLNDYKTERAWYKKGLVVDVEEWEAERLLALPHIFQAVEPGAVVAPGPAVDPIIAEALAQVGRQMTEATDAAIMAGEEPQRPRRKRREAEEE
ncbi:MAG: hypothetical protein BWY79_00088 [Actinobacteria bacterium ADurb.Bin444]|nr:MAG: hypothetical protein BWY79_00088 [Actinobacteria bacterium ADurb.Bin444]